MIDLDHNATTRLDPKVVRAMTSWLQTADTRRNPSSVHQAGRVARADIETARRRVAAAVGADPLDVTFCSGGTEADALAVLGVCRALRRRGRPSGLLTSPLEHAAVLGCADTLRDAGHEVVFVDVDSAGRIDAGQVARALENNSELGLVSLAAANHELGNRYDVPAFAASVRSSRQDVLVHCDAVQALGKFTIDFDAWDVDLLSVSAHKIHGPAGVGALICRRELELVPLCPGGSQERGRRPGTESALAIHGFGCAAALVEDTLATTSGHVRALREYFRTALQRLSEPKAEILGDGDHHVGNTLCVLFRGCPGELVMMNLDLLGIAVSTGSACSVGRVEPSPVAMALGFDRRDAECVVRFSLGADNTRDEIDRVLALLPDVLARVLASRAAEVGA